MAFIYSPWENWSYDISLTDVLAAQRDSTLGRFVDVDTLQLTARVDAGPDADAINDFIDPLDVLSGATRGLADHARHGDGGLTISEFWSVPPPDAASFNSSTTQNFTSFYGPGAGDGVPISITWAVSDVSQDTEWHATVSWTLTNPANWDPSLTVRLVADSYTRTRERLDQAYANGALDSGSYDDVATPTAIGAGSKTISWGGAGPYFILLMGITGSAQVSYDNVFGYGTSDSFCQLGVPIDSASLPAVDTSPALVTSGRGFRRLTSFTCPFNGDYTEANSVIAGTRTTVDTTSSEIYPYTDSSHTAGDHIDVVNTAHADSFQGAFTFKTPPTDWAAVLAANTDLAPQVDASGGIYGDDATYDYDMQTQWLLAKLDAAQPTSGLRAASGDVYGKVVPWDTVAALAYTWHQPEELASGGGDPSTSVVDLESTLDAASTTYVKQLDETELADGVAIAVTSHELYGNLASFGDLGLPYVEVKGFVRVKGRRRVRYAIVEEVLGDEGNAGRVVFEPV